MSFKTEQLKKQSALAALEALIASKAAEVANSKYAAESAKDEFISSSNDTGKAMQWLYEQAKAENLNEEIVRLTALAAELKASFAQQV